MLISWRVHSSSQSCVFRLDFNLWEICSHKTLFSCWLLLSNWSGVTDGWQTLDPPPASFGVLVFLFFRIWGISFLKTWHDIPKGVKRVKRLEVVGFSTWSHQKKHGMDDTWQIKLPNGFSKYTFRKLTCQQKTHHEWRCISYWAIWDIPASHVSFQGSCSRFVSKCGRPSEKKNPPNDSDVTPRMVRGCMASWAEINHCGFWWAPPVLLMVTRNPKGRFPPFGWYRNCVEIMRYTPKNSTGEFAGFLVAINGMLNVETDVT